MTKEEFLREYVSLCRKSGYCLISDDPYESIVLSNLDGSSSNPDEVLDDYWIPSMLYINEP